MVYYRVACERFAQKESTFEGKNENKPMVDEAPVRDYKGHTAGLILTPPSINKRSDDYRYAGD